MSTKDNKFDQLIAYIQKNGSSIHFDTATQLIIKIKELQSSQCRCGTKMGVWCTCGKYICESHQKSRAIYGCVNCHEPICNTCGEECETCTKAAFCIPCFVKHKCKECEDCGHVLMQNIYDDEDTLCNVCVDSALQQIIDKNPKKKSRVQKRKK